MAVEPRGQAIRVMINLVNRKREEPTGCGGGRQPSLDGTSRVTGDCHARICERLGVKLPGATRRQRVIAVPTATTVPIPPFVKVAIDAWTAAAGLSKGPLFRRVRRREYPEKTP